MRRTFSKVLAIAMAATLALSGCGGSNNNSSTGGDTSQTTANGSTTEAGGTNTPAKDAIKDLVTYELTSRELETQNILVTQMATDSQVLTNLIDSLVSADPSGKLVPAIAESWETTDGGLTWTFHLRNDVKWVDVNGNEKADCTAQDFVTGLEWVLNFYKNNAANTSMPIELIKGAGEYYEYTKSLSEEEALALDNTTFLEMVGIEAKDDYTLVYTCVEPKPYFDTVATYNCLYPAAAALIEELGAEGFRACNNENMWYNGAYLMTSYIQGNEKVLTKNPAYYDTECSRFDTVTIKMLDSIDVAFQLYQAGEIDNVTLSESNVNTIFNSESNEFHDEMVERLPTKYSYQFHFNYGKNNADGTPDTNWNTAIANEAFRLAWYYGLDLTTYYQRTNAINPLKLENNFYTMKGLVYLSDGTEYTELVKENLGLDDYNGETMVRADADKAAQYKAQAMEELSAKGVTFPVGVDYYIPASSQTQLDTANVLQQAFSDSLGDDFVKLNIKTYVSSQTQEVRNPKLQSFVINGWGADYGDPQNYLGQETYGEDNAWYSVAYSNINDATDPDLIAAYEEFTKLVNEANAITDDLDARYKAYAKAEAFLLSKALVMPSHYDIAWILTHINEYSKINAPYGIQNNKYVNWETSVDAYTTEQYQAFEAAKKGSN